MSAELRTHWGWHRLADEWACRLVRKAGVSPDDLVLDVGAGTGALTGPLLAAGARVVAIELHPGRANHLRERFPAARVVQADAADLRLPRRPFRVVANPPFATTTGLLGRLLSPASRLTRADLVVPRHVAARWAAGRGPGAARWTATFDLWVAGDIPRSAFRPPPPRPAAVLVIERRRLGR